MEQKQTKPKKSGAHFGIWVDDGLYSRIMARVGAEKTRNALARNALKFYLDACEQQAKTPAA